MGNFVEKLRRDSLPMGLFIGFICPAIFFGILYAVITLVQHQTGALQMDRMVQKLILFIPAHRLKQQPPENDFLQQCNKAHAYNAEHGSNRRIINAKAVPDIYRGY